MSWIVALHRRGGDRADAGDGYDRLRGLVGLDRRSKFLVDCSDRLVERIDMTDQRTQRRAHAIRNHDLAVVVKNVGGQALQVISMLRPLRCDDADLGHVPAQGVKQRGALAGEELRARWRINSAWLSIERTDTNL